MVERNAIEAPAETSPTPPAALSSFIWAIDPSLSSESELPEPTLAASVLPKPAASELAQSRSLKEVVQHAVGKDLQQVEHLLRAATSSRFAEVEELCRSAGAIGGKRLRPILLFLSAKAVADTRPNYRTERDLCSIAAAVELVHAASLVHDDVMDHATLRRHQPTVSEIAGNSAAVLLGDLLFTRAYGLAAQCVSTLPARQIAAAATRLCEGELRQQASAGHWAMDQSKYRSLLLQKTGALCAVSCRLGGWRAGGSRKQVRALARFGSCLGLAFQIHDDWLDYWGSEQVGKTLGTDLAQLKPTLPLIRLLAKADVAQRSRLIAMLESGESTQLAEFRARLNGSDAAQYTLRAARGYAEKAKLQLLELPASEYRDCLCAVAEYSILRDR